MRSVVIDTETTGLDPRQGHRIIELAAIELVDRHPTGRSVHFHVDPEREIDVAASEVHGMTWDDLRGKPRFAEVAPAFVAFARDAEWIIHNAPFDVGFLDAEFALAGTPPCHTIYGQLTDTLALARDLFPGKRASLDALCERFAVDHSGRAVHGALKDATLLAQVWLALTRGQETLSIDLPALSPTAHRVAAAATDAPRLAASRRIRVIAPDDNERALHEAYLAALDRESGGRCVWLAVATGGGVDG